MSMWDNVINRTKPDNRKPGYGASQHPVAPRPTTVTSMWDPVKAKIDPVPGPTVPNFTFPKVPNASTGTKHGSKAPSNNQGASGGSQLMQAAAAVNPALSLPDPRNDLNPIYDAAAARITELNSGLGTEFDNAIAALRARYEQSDGDIYNQYQNNRQALDASATGLGVNPADIYKGYDQDLRRVEENSNLQQNSSIDFFEKLKSLRGQQFTDMQASLEQQRAKALADQTAQWVNLIAQMQENSKAGSGGGGGGGRRGGGGSGSSGSVKEAATETSTIYDPQFMADYNELLRINPTAANAMMEAYLGSESSPSVKAITGAIATTAQDLKDNRYSMMDNLFGIGARKIQDLERNPFVAAPGAAQKERERQNRNHTNAQKLRDQQLARQYLIRTSGSLGNPAQKQEVKITGRS